MEITRPWAFAFAKGFRKRDSKQEFLYPPTRLEKAGSILGSGTRNVLDITLKEIKNPVMILGLTTIAAAGVTYLFYPEKIASHAPIVTKIRPWMIKAGVYVTLENSILGIALRNLGRLNNQPLRQAWNSGKLEPVYIGDRRVV